ncbi:class I SAM-dependent methyltransferase [Phaeobacter sp. C3_T13_0]|uniref:class I SAM-dependent methyltransferase n=1 Tax=Phaeobacter cretensis TaxID=3342641 RepID=UPI0039BC719D
MSLSDHIKSRIRAEGPISVADFMADALLHPTYGYYTTRDPLGAKGDFTTAPEISQMFGELIGLSLAQSWLDQGAPARFTLAELGPGRGTLMADLLRATKLVPGFHDAMQIVLLEASPILRARQADHLVHYNPQWHERITDLANQPLFLVANEFFDALPVRQFLRDGDGWREKSVGLHDDILSFGLGSASSQPALIHRLDDTKDGDLVELCETAQPMIQTIASRISDHGGAALILDYGDWRSLGDTLQALRAHEPSAPLDHPGKADLTTHVDFEALALAAKSAGSAYSRLTPQGVFLERLGITERAQALASRLKGDARQSLVAAHRRLTHPEEMGNLFKVLGIFPTQAPPPPGLNA